MSRIAKKPLAIPSGVDVRLESGVVVVKGPKGELRRTLHPHVHVANDAGALTVTVDQPDNVEDRALWGTFGSHIRNMMQGVTQGYTKQLEINGIGFKAQVSGQKLVLNVGFTHPIEYQLPMGIAATVEKNMITVSGIDKELVGAAAAHIRGVKPPEPYQGKGIKYIDEVIRRKAGKAAKTGAAAA